MADRQQQFRSRLEFSSSEEWRGYVQGNVPPEEQAYVLEAGLTTLYLKFHHAQNIPVPQELRDALEHVKTLPDPERTTELGTINARLFAGMTRFQMNRPMVCPAPLDAFQSGSSLSVLLTQLERENHAFALWCSYKRAESQQARLPAWEEYVRVLLSEEDNDTVEFVLSMGTLGELLHHLRDQRSPLSPILANKIRMLHREREGEERNLAAGMVLNELLEVIHPCASA
jgi:hypothetical protein